VNTVVAAAAVVVTAVAAAAVAVVVVVAAVVTVINFLKQFQRAAFRNGRRPVHFAAKIFDSLCLRRIR
jgi:protein-disulfide isomerase-like protein with CxxC motif